MQIERANPFLNEILEGLHEHYVSNGSDTDRAFNRLSKSESDWIDEEMFHVMTDPLYYMQNYHAIKTEEKGIRCLFPLWESQEIFYEEFWTLYKKGGKVKIIVLKARQLGLSTLSDALVFHKIIFTKAANGAVIAQDGKQAGYLFDMARNAYDYLPWWMKPEKRYEQAGALMAFDRVKDEIRELRPGLKSNIFVEAADKPSGAFRGKSIRAIHISELGLWNDPSQLTKSIFPTMNASDTLGIIESTACGRTGFFYEYWNRTMNGKTDWHPVFIEFFREHRKYSTPIAKNEVFELDQDEIETREKTLKDTGFRITDETFKWMRVKREEFIAADGDDSMMFQEYPSTAEEAFQASGYCAFDRKQLYRMMKHTDNPILVGDVEFDRALKKPLFTWRTPKHGEQIHEPEWSDRLFIWEKPVEHRQYYIAADVSQGNEGGDFSCVQVLKIGRGQEPDEQVAEWRGWINPYGLADVVAALAYWYYMPEVCIEVTGVGIVTNGELQRAIEYDEMYRWKHIDKIKGVMTDYTGFVTNDKSRKAIVAKTARSVIQKTIIIRSKWLINEMIDFAQEYEGGKFEAQEGNDDRVMAFMIAHYCSHESEYGQDAMSQPMSGTQGGVAPVMWFVYDKFGRMISPSTGIDREAAMKMSKSRLGSSVRQEAQARDFQNTAFSPVHHGGGVESRMHYDSGIAAEAITHESRNEYEWQESVEETDPDAWMFL